MRSRDTLALVGARSRRQRVSKPVTAVGAACSVKNLASRMDSVSMIRALIYQTERTKMHRAGLRRNSRSKLHRSRCADANHPLHVRDPRARPRRQPLLPETKIDEELFRSLEGRIVDRGEDERDPYATRGFPEREARSNSAENGGVPMGVRGPRCRCWVELWDASFEVVRQKAGGE